MSDLLRSFRRNVVHVRRALTLGDLPPAAPTVQDGGFLQDDGRFEHYKQLATPVRRALNRADRASLEQALEELRPYHRTDPDWPNVEQAWMGLRAELESTVALGGGKITRGQILTRWLEAAAFYDPHDHDRAYDRMLHEWGNPAENIGWQLACDAAALILRVDEAAAAYLEEPVILPSPPKAPPPPPEGVSWWRRFYKGRTEREGKGK